MPVWNHDETVRNNIIACNRDGQIWGWFDMKDNRHWPASAQSDGTAPGAGFASLTAKAQNQPSGLTLEKLNLRFENNVYYAGPGQGWFGWGPTWTRHKSYSSLHDFQAELGIDTGSRVADPGFADLMARDFRLKGAAMEQFKQCYPREPVPEVSLGIQP
jgi:hypothetical protein